MKIAIVGSGVSGLAATWLLNEYTHHEVHLYEAGSRPGGHVNTATFVQPGKEPAEVDTAFIVFNPIMYPNFVRFLQQYPSLRERIISSLMSFTVTRDGGAFMWASSCLRSFFCQSFRVFDPRMWRMLYDIVRFNACAPNLLVEPEPIDRDEITVGEYIRREGYSDFFKDNYLIPLTAAIWSTPPDKCALDFPARTLIRFFQNHHLLSITKQATWFTFEGGSRIYVDHIISSLPAAQFHLSTPVRSVSSVPSDGTASGSPYQVELTTAAGERVLYDHVILACHSNESLQILRNGGVVTADEERILGSVQWTPNKVVLHCDERFMPPRRDLWSCWNYLTKPGADSSGQGKPNATNVSITFWMNVLQRLPMERHGLVLVTVNPPFEPDPAKVVGQFSFDHPVLSTKTVRAQQELPAIQRTRGISYAGGWMNYGFHEDGFTAGLRAASALLLTDANTSKTKGGAPFPIADADALQAHRPVWYAGVFDAVETVGLRGAVGTLFCWLLGAARVIAGALGVEGAKVLNAELRRDAARGFVG
ncbi:FAD/NAD(P)-binding domain-containing protein [Sparassis latifolia]